MLSQHQRFLKLELAIGMLTAGITTRAVAREIHFYFSTITHLQCHFREFGSTSNWSHKRRPRNHTSPELPHLASSPARSETSLPDRNTPQFHQLSIIKPFCGEKLILIGWAWLPSGWAYALTCAPLPSHMKSID